MPPPEQSSFKVFRDQIVAALSKPALENGDKLQRKNGSVTKSLLYFHNDDREAILVIDDVDKLLGRGACARVVKGCLFYPSGEKKEVAVKIASSPQLLREEIRSDLPVDIVREKEIAFQVGLAQFFARRHSTTQKKRSGKDVLEYPKGEKFYLVMDRFDGSMDKVFDPSSPFYSRRSDSTFLTRIIKQSFAALAELHRQGILHTDVKRENICLKTKENSEFDLRFVDYGLSHQADRELLDRPVQKIQGTFPYMPEFCDDDGVYLPDKMDAVWKREQEQRSVSLRNRDVFGLVKVLDELLRSANTRALPVYRIIFRLLFKCRFDALPATQDLSYLIANAERVESVMFALLRRKYRSGLGALSEVDLSLLLREDCLSVLSETIASLQYDDALQALNQYLERQPNKPISLSAYRLIDLIKEQKNTLQASQTLSGNNLQLLMRALQNIQQFIENPSSENRREYVRCANKIGMKNWDRAQRVKENLLCLGVVVLIGVLIATTLLVCGGNVFGFHFSVALLAKIGPAAQVATGVIAAALSSVAIFGTYRYHKPKVVDEMVQFESQVPVVR